MITPVSAYTDVRPLHILEDWGFRTYVVLVCEGAASIVRLGVTLEGHKSPDELARALDEQLSRFQGRLDALDPEQQRDFAAQVDETVDPYLLIDRIAHR